MQTPISFALEILLDCETIEKAHKACRKYIRELERGQLNSPIRTNLHITPTTQAPSTQRLLEQQGIAQPAAPPIAPARIVGGEINNGDGTKGKRKW
jgi:hypothetical protein